MLRGGEYEKLEAGEQEVFFERYAIVSQAEIVEAFGRRDGHSLGQVNLVKKILTKTTTV